MNSGGLESAVSFGTYWMCTLCKFSVSTIFLWWNLNKYILQIHQVLHSEAEAVNMWYDIVNTIW